MHAVEQTELGIILSELSISGVYRGPLVLRLFHWIWKGRPFTCRPRHLKRAWQRSSAGAARNELPSCARKRCRAVSPLANTLSVRIIPRSDIVQEHVPRSQGA